MMDSQLEILKSENFALSIVKNLHLTQDPEFVEAQWRADRHCKKRNIYKLFTSNKRRTEIRI